MISRRGICLKVSAVAASVVAVVFASLFLVAQPVQASSDDEVMKKALAGAMEMCYRNRGSAFKSPIDTSEYFSIDSAANAWGSYYMPTNIGNDMGTTPINCKEVFLGVQGGFLGSSTKLQGILARFGKSDYGVTPENLGYVDDNSGSASSQGYSCFNLSYHLFSSASDFTNKTSNKVCFPTDSSGKINIDNPQNVKLEDEGNVTSELGSLKIEYDSSMDCIRYSAMNPPAGESWGQGTGYGCFAWGVDGKTPSEVVQAMNSGASDIVANKGMIMTPEFFSVYQASEPAHKPTASQSTSQSSLSSSMVLNDMSSVQTINWLKGGDNGYIGMTFGPDDWAYIYTTYIKRLRESGQISVNNDCTTDKSKYTYAVTSDNGTTWCEVLGAESVTEQFAGQSGNSNKVLELMPFTKILEKYKNLNFANVDSGTTGGVVGNDPGNNGDPDNVDDQSTMAACYSGTGVLGWIVCPVIELVGNATGFLYDKFIEPALEVKAETIMSRDKGVYVGWAAFRDIANIIFAIFFIVIILSQVTGIGVSNYGIKKLLPRFIVVVVLVNLSFIICQLAVDLSNILGVGLRNIFQTLPLPTLPDNQTSVNPGSIAGSIVSMLGLAAGAVAVFQLPVITSTIGYWILPILLALLGCLISVIFFFIILGVRQAGVVILVVLAPVAIICYALPNTKTFFDRWRKLFTAMLFVYPICGLLMGGGEYAGALLMSIDTEGDMGFFYTLTAMLVTVVPFFMIPSLLKSSMAAMGNLGMKISSLERSVRGGITGGIRKTQAYQEHQQERQRTMNMRRNSRIAARNGGERFNELQGKIDRHEQLTAREQREYNRLSYRRARALAGNKKIYNEDNMAAAMAQGEDLAGIDYGNVRRIADIQRYRGRDTEDLSHGYSTMYQNDGTAGSVTEQQKKLEAALKTLEEKPEDQDAQARFRALVRMMSNSDDGRAALERTMKSRIKAVADRGGAGKDQNKGLQWAANEALAGPNGKEFKRVASSLFRTLSDVAEGGPNHKYTDMAADYNTDGTLSATASDTAYAEGIDRMAADVLPDIDDREFNKYITGLRNGKITGAARAKLISSAVDALNDPRIKLKPKTAKFVHEIANMGYTQNTSSADLHGSNFNAVNVNDAATMASAGASELDRIAEGFRNGTIAGDDHSTGNMSDMLNVIQKALEEARLNGGMVGGVELTGSNASKMLKILKDNGRTLVDAGGAHLSDADYGSLMRIKHSRASYSSNWRQATPADIITTPGINVGDWVDVSGAHPRLLNAQELREVQAVNEFNVRQKVKESADNGTPTP